MSGNHETKESSSEATQAKINHRSVRRLQQKRRTKSGANGADVVANPRITREMAVNLHNAVDVVVVVALANG